MRSALPTLRSAIIQYTTDLSMQYRANVLHVYDILLHWIL